jgi:protein transport protein SEC24
MFVVTDIDAVYLPQPEDLLVNLTDSLDLITSLLDSLPTLFHKT